MSLEATKNAQSKHQFMWKPRKKARKKAAQMMEKNRNLKNNYMVTYNIINIMR